MIYLCTDINAIGALEIMNFVSSFLDSKRIDSRIISDFKYVEKLEIEKNDILLCGVPIDNFQKKGVRHVICTDIEKDGMLKGVSINLYEKILNKFDKIKLIASGGFSDIDQIRDLKEIGCFGVIIGKAIYEKSIDLKTLSNFVND